MERNLRKERVGIVVSDKMDKTVVVAVTDKSKHPVYKKTITRTVRRERVRRRRQSPYRGNEEAEQRQKLARSRNRRKGEVIRKGE